MNLKLVYTKTPKGQEEIANRNQGLSARLRTCLLMVDGKIVIGDLVTRAPDPPEAEKRFAVLEEQGFIAPLGVEAAKPVTLDNRAEMLRFVSRFLLDALGPQADNWLLKIEQTKNIDDLMQQIERARAVVEGVRGKRKGEEFWEGIQKLREGSTPN